MLIQTNQSLIKQPTVPVEAVEAWLAEHPEKTAEALTGVVSDKPQKFVISDGNKQPPQKPTAKKKRKKPAYTLKDVLVDFEELILQGEIVTPDRFKQYSKNSVVTIVTQLRSKGHDILTLNKPGGFIGWISTKALLTNNHKAFEGE